MTSSPEFPVHPERMSDAERERTLKALRDGAASGKLSHDTFVLRMEQALVARRSDELAQLTADLRSEGPMARVVFGTVRACSGFTVRLRRAWQGERLPKLLLPAPTSAHPLRIGRDPGNGLRLTHETVSRAHAELSHQGGVWVLKDLGSSNGTTVNGRRVVDVAVVRDGDQIAFGTMAFRVSTS
ncbi:FHA domain-containing protein [Streptomyces sp. NPDC058045]|uniref:FHA domain-containing protein n=1 Tax=Streptomyces sp. NPDC058045 TaxID=3346311 RepID=UPI0036EF7E00